MTTLTPVNVATMTAAIVSALSADPRLREVRIDRSSDQNLDSGQCPWVGVYRMGAQYPIRQLVGVSGYRQQRVRFLIMAQQSDAVSGENCEDALEELVQAVLSVLFSDESLQRSVGMLDEFEIDYSSYVRTGGVYMQTAVIQFVGISNVQLGG